VKKNDGLLFAFMIF